MKYNSLIEGSKSNISSYLDSIESAIGKLNKVKLNNSKEPEEKYVTLVRTVVKKAEKIGKVLDRRDKAIDKLKSLKGDLEKANPAKYGKSNEDSIIESLGDLDNLLDNRDDLAVKEPIEDDVLEDLLSGDESPSAEYSLDEALRSFEDALIEDGLINDSRKRAN